MLGLKEVDRLVHTVTEELTIHDLTTLSSFPAWHLMSTLLEFIASYKLSFVPVYLSLRQTQNGHGTKRPALLLPPSLPCFSAGVSLVFCVFLQAVPFMVSSLGTCTSTGVKPKSVSNLLPSVLTHSVYCQHIR